MISAKTTMTMASHPMMMALRTVMKVKEPVPEGIDNAAEDL
jgi:hypothetical protein